MNFTKFLGYLKEVTQDYKKINLIDPFDQEQRVKLIKKLAKSEKITDPKHSVAKGEISIYQVGKRKFKKITI